MKKIIQLFMLVVLIVSCGRKQSGEVMYDMAGTAEDVIPVERPPHSAPPSPPLPAVENREVIKKKIIKDGRLGIRVRELENAKIQIDSLVKKYKGYYANEQMNNTDWESSYYLKIRVPAVHFDNLIAAIESGDGEIQFKEIDARDVTDEFIDLETRLKNKRNYLNRYNDLLKQAKSIKDILEIEEKIRGLEEEIESTTGRLKYLNDQVDYSTLDLTLSKRKDFKYNPANRDKFSERLKQSLSKGWFGFVDFLLFVIKIWPFWLILTGIIYLWKKYRKTRKK